MTKRNIEASIKGSFSEIIVMLRLLQNGFNITLSSPKIKKGIDFFVLNKKGKLFPIEVKSRPYPEEGDNIRIKKHKFYKNLIIILYSWVSGDMWILPSKIYGKYCNSWERSYVFDISKVKDEKEIQNCRVPEGYRVLRKLTSK